MDDFGIRQNTGNQADLRIVARHFVGDAFGLAGRVELTNRLDITLSQLFGVFVA